MISDVKIKNGFLSKESGCCSGCIVPLLVLLLFEEGGEDGARVGTEELVELLGVGGAVAFVCLVILNGAGGSEALYGPKPIPVFSNLVLFLG